mmetsp:Transcript_37160/g.41543  ORF Transcript_37160/g.41543 Transcript_37160/m.41543 type:complete len:160 (+) Transcript_37160:87-566(+)
MMMFTRPAVRAVTAHAVPMLRAAGKQSSLSPRAAGCYFSSLVERSSTDYSTNMNVTISNNNNVVLFNNQFVASFPVPVHDVAESSFFSSAAVLSLVRNTNTVQAVRSTNDFEPEVNNTLIQTLNRNARRGKKANHGSRPCSRVGRRKRKEAIGSRKRTR